MQGVLKIASLPCILAIEVVEEDAVWRAVFFAIY
jgi:hypothetical protein